MAQHDAPKCLRLDRLAQEPGAFFSLLQMGDKDGKLVSLSVPFAEQALALEDLSSGASLVVYLKPRQVGASTLALAWNFWRVYWTKNPIRCLVAADSYDTTDALLPRVKGFHARLPKMLQRKLERANDNELLFADTQAGIRVLTAGGRSKGRGWTYQLLQAEELSRWPNDEENWAAITSTMGDSEANQVIVLATPNGPDNLYHRMVLQAQEAQAAGDKTVRFRFFAWFDHLGYRKDPPAKDDWLTDDDLEVEERFGLDRAQTYWRAMKIRGPKGIGLAKFRREYPMTLEDGFLVGEGCWFDSNALNTVLADLERRDKVHGGYDGELRIYEPPTASMTYCIGADPSWCSTDTEKGGDYAAAQVLSHDGRQVATLSMNKGGEQRFAQHVIDLSVRYRRARVLVEANPGGAGKTVLRLLQQYGVPLWKTPARAGSKPKFWTTTHGVKEEGYAHLRQSVDGDALTLNDVRTVQELLHIREENNTIGGRDGYHDDHAMALMLAEWNRRTLPATPPRPRWAVKEQKSAVVNLFNPRR